MTYLERRARGSCIHVYVLTPRQLVAGAQPSLVILSWRRVKARYITKAVGMDVSMRDINLFLALDDLGKTAKPEMVLTVGPSSQCLQSRPLSFLRAVDS